MGYYLSGITWFDEDVWIGREFILLQSKWKLAQKLAEVEQVSTEQDVRELALMSESRSVFIASNIESSGQEAVVKFRMQIPYFSTAFKTRQVRAKQAAPDIRKYSQYEIRALEHLTKLKCSSTPAIFAWKHETQGDDDWVPGGYLDYILMERLPGSRPNGFPGSMERKDRDQLRAAFKKAWIECVACGLVPEDSAIRNLIWDRENQKCYIVDWEEWSEATSKDTWRDLQYVVWNLARVSKGDYNDMSTWIL